IIAEDEYGATTNGPIWHFTTEEESVYEPDLDCYGDLSWVDVTTGETVTGSFTVENTGDSTSELDWEIESYPDWGDWTFDPENGQDLTPEDGPVTVDVTVVAPEQESAVKIGIQKLNELYTGEVKIVNSEDSSDYCTIDASLETPVSQNLMYLQYMQFLQRIIYQFPMLEHMI
ncbi:MAG: hypothetical protein KAW47_06720, partial [Thermoplasmatales archaeon]|nr:hypothetical protein [Thermoplasmatales archaeon]